jgi:hypothetical protein
VPRLLHAKPGMTELATAEQDGPMFRADGQPAQLPKGPKIRCGVGLQAQSTRRKPVGS